MNSKFKKIVLSCLVITSFTASITPTISGSVVYASTSKSSLTFDSNKKVTKDAFYAFVDYGVKNYHLEVEYAEALAYHLFKDNLDFLYIENRAPLFTSKGITVEAMGYIIDGILVFALGTAFKSVLMNYYRASNWKGLSEVSRMLKNELIKKGFAPIAGLVDGSLGVLAFILEPGPYLARLWDAHDKVPNNGHINLEFW